MRMTLTRRSFIGAAAALLASPASRNYAFRHANWFDGKRFRGGDLYSVDGTLTFRRPLHLEESFDLSGKFVIPPLGEAHNHNVESSPRLDALIGNYLRDGIFYVKKPCIALGSRRAIADKVNTPSSIDVSFSNGG